VRQRQGSLCVPCVPASFSPDCWHACRCGVGSHGPLCFASTDTVCHVAGNAIASVNISTGQKVRAGQLFWFCVRRHGLLAELRCFCRHIVRQQSCGAMAGCKSVAASDANLSAGYTSWRGARHSSFWSALPPQAHSLCHQGVPFVAHSASAHHVNHGALRSAVRLCTDANHCIAPRVWHASASAE
jgi:hypothetical protein